MLDFRERTCGEHSEFVLDSGLGGANDDRVLYAKVSKDFRVHVRVHSFLPLVEVGASKTDFDLQILSRSGILSKVVSEKLVDQISARLGSPVLGNQVLLLRLLLD